MAFPSREYRLNQNDSNTSSVIKGIFLRNLDRDTDSYFKYYRNLLGTKALGGLKSHGVRCESVSEVKEIRNSDDMFRSNPYYAVTNSLASKLIGIPKKSLKLNAATSVNIFQRKPYPDRSSRARSKRSASEPNLTASVKVPGENLAIREKYRENTFLASQLYGNGKSVPLTQTELGGTIYIKNAGKIYTSKLVAKQFCAEENDVFWTTNKEKIPPVENIVSKRNFTASFAAGNKSLNRAEGGDFEIAIFLSGPKNNPERHPQVQDEQHLAVKRIEGEIRKAKKEKSNSQKSSKINADRSSRSYRRLNKSCARSVLSSKGSEGDYLSAKNSNSEIPNGRRTERKKTYSRNSLIPKISNNELWERFESTFKSYASTHRHSGDVIPKKISTEWMLDVGVVPEILTEKEADKEFRNSAGARLTMNTKEYKEFLIMLSLQKKLPCYEIYHRMCGMYKEDKTS